jgi:hypothetical protein
MDDEPLAVAEEAEEELSEHVRFRVVWAETVPLAPVEGEPGFGS